jgi:heme-degrading monooxygenase HmoA
MVHVMIRHEVQDYSRWRAAFDDALMVRRHAGEQAYHIFRNFEDANEVTVLCDFDTLERARNFITSDELKSAMKAAGVTGETEVRFLHEALNIRRSSAD